ncbi:MAG: hypothetical protein F2667_04430 [Actinobacteria bacterium]|nr:hypothetical protein [Actinomycetota bacterium]
MNLKQMIDKLRADLAPRLAERTEARTKIDAVRAACVTESRDPSETEAADVVRLSARVSEIDTEVDRVNAQIAEYQEELRRDEALDALAREVHPTGVTLPGGPEQRMEVSDRRTYRTESDRTGQQFLRDVAAQFIFGAAATESNERLAAHMREERAERGEQIDRAAGTSAFAGLVVPQYLTDLYAPKARTGRPFADACRHHDLPETGMTVYIGKVTTGTTTDLQAAEFDTVNETDIDDTLMSINVQTNAGAQTISRQGLERGVGVEDTTMQDLFGAYASTLDSKLLNQATTGLTNVASTIAYTDASPTAAELYPKLVAAPAAVEAALLNQHQGDNIAVMNSRRWYWLQSQLTTSWPMFGASGIPAQNSGLDYGKTYGSGFRGVLPTGTVVIVDNNVAVNLGAGTNEDEIYFGAQSELHLWEDPNAPMLLRAEQSQVKKLAVDFVAYGYFAYTFTRRPHAQKVAGTGLVTPAFA